MNCFSILALSCVYAVACCTQPREGSEASVYAGVSGRWLNHPQSVFGSHEQIRIDPNHSLEHRYCVAKASLKVLQPCL